MCPSYRTGVVDEVLGERDGLQRVLVDGERAYVLTQLIGSVAVGDRVVMNTTAVELGLGTGGWHVVHWNLARDSLSQPGPGHIMKLRYTSLQVDTDPAAAAESLDGTPVVACALHSQVACVAVAFAERAPDRRLVYVMTDAGSLPLALSDLVHDLRGASLLHTTVTCGHAFGGEREAVTLASGLLAAKEAGADAIVAGMGPGSLGTDSRYGFSGLEVASIVDTTNALAGRAIVAARYSEADERDRHRGLSHHTRTALEVARTTPEVPEPDDHLDVPALLARHGLEVRSMGRGPAEDPAFYAWAGAAGTRAAELVTAR